jgi:NADPH:quinone reductase-like Zn-dependent oxidoreductase
MLALINTGSDKWIEHVREITAGKGVDLASDPVAGPGLEHRGSPSPALARGILGFVLTLVSAAIQALSVFR